MAFYIIAAIAWTICAGCTIYVIRGQYRIYRWRRANRRKDTP